MAHPLSDAAVPLDFADADPFSSEDADFAQALEDDLWNGDEESNSEDEENGDDGCGKDPGFEDGSDGDADDADRSDGGSLDLPPRPYVPVRGGKLVEMGEGGRGEGELCRHVHTFLSAEDLSVCACRYLRTASCEETLWHRAYCIRWGRLPQLPLPLPSPPLIPLCPTTPPPSHLSRTCRCVSLPPHGIMRGDPLAPLAPFHATPVSLPPLFLCLPHSPRPPHHDLSVCACVSLPPHGIMRGDSLALRLLHPMGALLPLLPPHPPHSLLSPCPPCSPHQDLSVCACVCRYLRTASSEETLWRRAYCIRWGPPPPPPPSSTRSALDGRGGSGGMRGGGEGGGGGGGGEGGGGGGGGEGGGGAGVQARSLWKRLYFERDRGEMKEFVADSPQDLRGFYAQLQAAKRNLVPRRDQVYDELVHVTSDLARAVAEWRQQNKLPERVEEAHWCTGGNCTFHRIENVFLCEKTGRAHGEWGVGRRASFEET
ncbi:unnamed protein product [Closterium sp. Naga37s-1]|nr:unnamed protein product [Closterium sp. Naga37s-1]